MGLPAFLRKGRSSGDELQAVETREERELLVTQTSGRRLIDLAIMQEPDHAEGEPRVLLEAQGASLTAAEAWVLAAALIEGAQLLGS